MPRNKKKQAPINLANVVVEDNGQFEVTDYDYEAMQGEKAADPEFETDLAYLLNDADETPRVQLEAHKVEEIEKKAKKKHRNIKLSVVDITKDIDDITFSSDDEVTPGFKYGEKKPIQKKGKKGKKDKTIEEESPATEEHPNKSKAKTEKKPVFVDQDEYEPKISFELTDAEKEKRRLKNQKRRERRDKRDREINKEKEVKVEGGSEQTHVAEAEQGVEEKLKSTEGLKKKEKKAKKNKKKLKENKQKEAKELEAEDNQVVANGAVEQEQKVVEEKDVESQGKQIEAEQVDVDINSKKAQPEAKDTEDTEAGGKVVNSSVEGEVPEATITPSETQAPEEDSFVKDTETEDDETEDNDAADTTETPETESTPESVADIPDTPESSKSTTGVLSARGLKPTPPRVFRDITPSDKFGSLQLENPFDIKLRSVKNTTMNSKYSEKMPEIQPIKTIIGLSHLQILRLDASDVKIKTIVSSATISKYATTALNFSIKHTEDLFGDEEKKTIFFLLCVNVALYESVGFKKTVQIHPNILELFGGYEQINLETTKTKLTPSTKDIHHNNLDYSVLSYIGNVLIWAIHQQIQGKVDLLSEKYNIELTAKLVREHIGGYHLWDRLLREQSMNAKRWKHVIKFRQAFAYEEDQFMLILRFMKVNMPIP